MARERMEWTHYESWEGDRKVLAVGDSIVWGAHKYMESQLGELALTTVVSAHGVNEEQFQRSVAMLATLNDEEYEVVYFNNGLHTRGQTPSEYAANYEKTLRELMRLIPAKKWILGLSTPISNKQTDKWDNTTPISNQEYRTLEEANALVIEFNEKVKEIAEKLDLPYYDAYSLMADKNDLKIDPYHYNADGRRIFAEAVCKRILEETE